MFTRIKIFAFSYTRIYFAFGCNIWKEITMVQKDDYKHSFFQRFTNMYTFGSKRIFRLKNNPQFLIVVVNFMLIYLFFIFPGCQNRFRVTFSYYFTRHELTFQRKIYWRREWWSFVFPFFLSYSRRIYEQFDAKCV